MAKYRTGMRNYNALENITIIIPEFQKIKRHNDQKMTYSSLELVLIEHFSKILKKKLSS